MKRAVMLGCALSGAWLTVLAVHPFHAQAQAPRAVAVIAHRGEHLHHPENTLPAFQAAIDAQADYFECDVRTTSDGRMVLMHDATVDRTTDGHGEVSKLTFDQIRAFDAGVHANGVWKGTRVPTFEEALQLAKGRIQVYVDNKNTDPAALVSAIDAAGMGSRVVIYAAPSALSHLHQLRPSWRVMPEAEEASRLQGLIQTLGLKVVAFDAGDFKPPVVEVARKAGLDVFVDRLWEFDSEPHWQAAIDAGATGIQSDHPAELVRYLRERRFHP